MSHSHATAPARYDTRGRKRHANPISRRGHAPANKGRRFPPEALTTTEAQQLLRGCVPTSKYAGADVKLAGHRLRGALILMYRTGLRVQECLDLEERDLNVAEGQITVRCGKGGKRRVVAMDPWGWQQLAHWTELRRDLPPGKLFCVVSGATAGRPWSQTDLRRSMRAAAARAGLRRRVHPHALRHTFAVEAWREGIDVVTISRQLGHARLDVTQAYLISLGADDLLTPVFDRKVPMVPLSMQ